MCETGKRDFFSPYETEQEKKEFSSGKNKKKTKKKKLFNKIFLLNFFFSFGLGVIS